jgi:hypothetical protein
LVLGNEVILLLCILILIIAKVGIEIILI